MASLKFPDQGSVRNKPKTIPLQFKRGTAEAFRRANPILLNGEPAWEWDTYRLKIGDGVKRYKQLPYITGGYDGKSAKDFGKSAPSAGRCGIIAAEAAIIHFAQRLAVPAAPAR